MPVSYGFLSTFPPTQCGVATFSQALFQNLTSSADGSGIIRVLDQSEAVGGDGVVGHLLAGSHLSELAAAAALNRYDVAVIQHEYGIYAGRDGDQVLAVLGRLHVPTIVVLHTVLAMPTPHQRSVLERVADAADVVVVMSRTAAARLFRGYLVKPAKVVVIAHGAHTHAPEFDPRPEEQSSAARGPMILSWGLLGPGKGLEWAIDALAHLRDLVPAPRYLIAGQTHPKVLERDGEAYRESLMQRAVVRGVAGMVRFDPRYRDSSSLVSLVRSADVVVMPYDSSEQATSGVLIEAVAALRPVVATKFPHARELLGDGSGLLVDHRDPIGIAAALRRVLTEPGLAARMSASAARIAPGLAWTGVAERYRSLAEGLLAARAEAADTAETAEAGRPGMSADSTTTTTTTTTTTAAVASAQAQRAPGLDLRHLLRLSDEVGLLEHALGAVPRVEHGYCVDDAARAVVLLCREPNPSAEVAELAARYTVFLARAQEPDGGFHNRLGYDGYWQDGPGTGDWWGRALWGLGTAAARGPHWMRSTALSCFARGAGLRPPHVRAMAFAALGAAQVLTAHPRHRAARGLLADAAAAIGPDGPDGTWPWPQERLHYANAALPEVLISAGHYLKDPALEERGLRLLGWLLETESAPGHFSPTPVGGRSPGDQRPGFDQQPIEIAALADACASALAVTGDPRWARAIRLAAAWFNGENDARAPMRDPVTGGGYDGLTPSGPNQNQGAESTLALLCTLQHHRRLQTEES